MMFRLTAAALLALLPLAKASPGGAPTCVGDESAPGDPHRAAGFTEETIAEGGLTITIGGETLEEGTPLDLVVGDTYEVTISTESSFRGVLARMAGGDAGVDTLGLFTVVDGDTSLQVSSFCDAAEVAGVTHTSRADKTSVTFLMSLDEPSQNMALDVNVVESNPNPSVFYYTQYLINAVAAPTGAPTSAPTSAPSGAPTVVPTVFPTMAPVSIYETGVAANFTVAALAAVAGLDGVLSDPNATLTLMAPTNEAFADLPGRIVNYLTSNVNTTLTFLLLGHVLPLVATAEVVVGLDGMEVTFLNNVSRTIEVSDDGVVSISCGCEGSESGARVVETDIMASNGVIHVIDRILGIPTLFEVVQTGGGALAGAFAASGLAERLRTLDGVTLFAPNTAGFQSLAETYSQLAGAVLSGNPGFTLHIQTLLLAHVADTVVFSEDLEDGMNVTMLSNDTFTVSINETVTIAPGSANGVATVVDPFDFITSQGSVHAIDAVLIPRFLQRTIVDIAVAETSTLASFVVAADLAETLSSTFGLTVFAPSNDAFAKLDNTTVTLLQSEDGKDMLVEILQYHVLEVGTVVPSAQVATGPVVTLLGAPIYIEVSDEAGVVLNDVSTVVVPDALANNGIVHIIDTVLTEFATFAPTSAPTGSPTKSPVADSPTSAPTAMPSVVDEEDEPDSSASMATGVAASVAAAFIWAMI